MLIESVVISSFSGLFIVIGGAMVKTWRDSHQNMKDIKSIQETDKEQWVEIKEIVSANRESILQMAEKAELDKLENEFREHIKESSEIRRELGEIKNEQKNVGKWLEEIRDYNKRIDEKFDRMIENERRERNK